MRITIYKWAHNLWRAISYFFFVNRQSTFPVLSFLPSIEWSDNHLTFKTNNLQGLFTDSSSGWEDHSNCWFSLFVVANRVVRLKLRERETISRLSPQWSNFWFLDFTWRLLFHSVVMECIYWWSNKGLAFIQLLFHNFLSAFKYLQAATRVTFGLKFFLVEFREKSEMLDFVHFGKFHNSFCKFIPIDYWKMTLSYSVLV